MFRFWVGVQKQERRREEKLIMSTSYVLNLEPNCRDEPLKSHKDPRKCAPSSLNLIYR